MKRNRILLLLFVGVLIVIIYYSLEESQTGDNYIAELQIDREEKDRQMITEGFPFAGAGESFEGLKYFEPNPDFRISARLTPIRNKKVVSLVTNDQKENRYFEYAYAEFSIEGVKCKLLILEIMEVGPTRGSLFLAFADDTSARETYGAGRYLDINKVPGSATILLDFNKAYNPYCAYSDDYSCPLPPRENILPVAIRAGEKTFK